LNARRARILFRVGCETFFDERPIDAERNSEFLIDIGGGKTMTAVIPRVRAEALAVREAARIEATFAAQNVILVVD